jgi:predicted MPP superfamily phosphohydrolase
VCGATCALTVLQSRVEMALTRREFMRGLTAAGLVGASATGTYASLVEPHAYELTETDIFISDLPPAFDGFRIAQLSDLHHSPIVPRIDVQHAVALAQTSGADMIVLTGDYTTARPSYVWPCAEMLGTLQAPAGVWAVLGNHDHYTDAELTTRALKRAHINVLDNAHTRITRGGDTLQLVGVDDWSWAKSDWARAFNGVDRRQPTILLSHQPAVLDLPETDGVSLILSGHTHGGQIRLPFVGAPVRFVNEFKYLRGHYRRGRTQLYVSRGTGTVGLPVRLGARPEVAVLRLRRAE